ncbi:MAG: ribosome recycling factor [Clostridia bacterium]|nr:ribosome recycling factor [Clostridia bacterium]
MKRDYSAVTTKMDKTISVLTSNLATIRAGRANPAVLDKISVDYYGVATPIQQVGNISVPEARTIIIQPWDASILGDIEKAINASDLGINPANDGKVIRLNFPPLTEERRKEIVKQVHKEGEESKVAIRSIRRDALEGYKKQQKSSEITEDDLKDIEKDIQDLTDKSIKNIDEIIKKKEAEILEV